MIEARTITPFDVVFSDNDHGHPWLDSKGRLRVEARLEKLTSCRVVVWIDPKRWAEHREECVEELVCRIQSRIDNLFKAIRPYHLEGSR